MEQEKKDYMEKVKDIVSTDKSEMLMATTKATVNGATIGLIMGMMIGYYRGTNLYASGLAGAVILGVATNLLTKKKQQ